MSSFKPRFAISKVPKTTFLLTFLLNILRLSSTFAVNREINDPLPFLAVNNACALMDRALHPYRMNNVMRNSSKHFFLVVVPLRISFRSTNNIHIKHIVVVVVVVRSIISV